MNRLLLTSLLLLPAFVGGSSQVQAQCAAGENCGAAAAAPAGAGYAPLSYALQPGPRHPHFPPFGCGGYCIGFLSRIHFHGPLYNYGPYSGYYPFEPYGPWTSDLRYNAPAGNCGWTGIHGPGWGKYALSTLKNVFHRTNPCAHKCGSGLNLGGCESGCGVSGCAGGGCAVAAAQPALPAQTVAAIPAVKMPIATGLLTGQVK